MCIVQRLLDGRQRLRGSPQVAVEVQREAVPPSAPRSGVQGVLRQEAAEAAHRAVVASGAFQQLDAGEEQAREFPAGAERPQECGKTRGGPEMHPFR